MARHVSDIAFTPAVKAQQDRLGSRAAYARMEGRGGWSDRITPELARFIGERDSFYLGTAGADGQPYIQHRGGPKGFLTVLDDHTLACADFSGNAQYVSIGNLTENDKAFIFLMDYPNRKRIKVWGTARYVEDDRKLLTQLVDPEYTARPPSGRSSSRSRRGTSTARSTSRRATPSRSSARRPREEQV